MPKLFKTYRLLTVLVFIVGFAAIFFIYYYKDFLFKQVSNVFSQNDLSHPYLKSVDFKIQSQWLKNVNYFRNEKVLLPEDWGIIVFASGLTNPSKLQVVDNTTVLVSEINTGNITVLKDSDYDNSANSTFVFDSGLSNPNGLYLYDKTLYVAADNAVFKYTNLQEQITSLQPEKVKIIDLPVGGVNNLKNLYINNNGLFVAVGSSCDFCIQPDKKRGALLKYNLDGGEEEIYASGLRKINSIVGVGSSLVVADDNTSNSSNNFDDEINIIQYGKFYGWPYFASNNISSNISTSDPNLSAQAVSPEFTFTNGSVPTGLEYVDSENKGALYITFGGLQKIIKIAFFEQQASFDDFAIFKPQKNSVIPNIGDIKRFKQGFLVTDSSRGVVYYIYPN